MPARSVSASLESLGLEPIFQRFEQAWRQGHSPAIDDYLPEVGPARRLALIELIHTDLELRLKAGQDARVESYLERYPDLQADAPAVLGFIAREFELRRRFEASLTADEYLRRFPQYRHELPDYLGRLTGPNTPAQAEGERRTPTDPSDAIPPTGTVQERTLPAIPGYEVLCELGQGGMGSVYKARDVRLGRLVAVKLLGSCGEKGRFRVEGEALAKLRHPHIVQVHSSGEAGGRPYLVMEYLERGSLAAAISGPQPVLDSARLVLLLARAVQHAHEHGIVHRDLKPANVLLAPVADEPALNCAWGCPKVADFGLARDAQSGHVRTLLGLVLGTPAYMAPEQADGLTQEVGPPTDVYALGVILYQLLTGEVPFAAESQRELLNRIVTSPPEPPARLRPEVPKVLEAICLKCLEKLPARRYGTARELAEELGRFLEGRKGPGGSGGRSGRRRPWLGVAVVAAMLAMLLVGLTWSLQRPVTPAGPLDPQVVLRVYAKGDPARDWLPLDQFGALPVRADELLRVEVTLARPGYVYLVLLASEGKAYPLYPWNRHGDMDVEDVDAPPADLGRVRQVSNPESASRGWRLDEHAGLETVLTLARSTPLPRRLKLSGLIGAVPNGDQAPLRDPGELMSRRLDRGDAAPWSLLDRSRGFAKKAGEVDKPVLRMMERLRQEFESVVAVRFAHVGK